MSDKLLLSNYASDDCLASVSSLVGRSTVFQEKISLQQSTYLLSRVCFAKPLMSRLPASSAKGCFSALQLQIIICWKPFIHLIGLFWDIKLYLAAQNQVTTLMYCVLVDFGLSLCETLEEAFVLG